MVLVRLPSSGLEPVTVQNLYSKTDMEKGLNDFFTQSLPKTEGINIYNGLANTKILLGFVCVAVGSYAQFMLKMPDDRSVLGVVISVYFLLSIVAFAFEKWYMSNGFITEFQYKDGEPIRLHISMQLFSDEVEMTMHQGDKTETSKKTCGKLFCDDGALDQKATYDEFNYVLHSLVKKKAS